MLIWRLFLKAMSLIFDNAMVALALVVLIIAGINYKALVQSLPNSVPEIDNWLADISPKKVDLRGSIDGVRECWRMTFLFLRPDGSPLLGSVRHVGQVSTLTPQASIELPYRDTYLLRLQTEVFLSNPENCLPIASGAILRSRVLETELKPRGSQFSLINTCDFTENNDCDFRLE